MKIIVTLSFLLLCPSVFAQTIDIKESESADKATAIVSSLPEVLNADNYVKRVSKGKRHLTSYLVSTPTKNVPYYWVKVVEDNGVALHAHFHFYVQPKTFKVFYLNVITDKIIPEKQCRRKLLAEYPIK